MPKTRRKGKPTRTAKSRRTIASQDDGWYSIKGILDERVVQERVEYLVNWEDNIHTGEAYSPTWVWSREVTDDAKEEWDQAKAARDTAKDNVPRPASADDGQDSQPPRPANWRTLQRTDALPLSRSRSASTLDDHHRRCKAPKVGYSATPSEEPVPSTTSAASPDTVETFDYKCAETAYDAARAGLLVVELTKAPQLDPSEYLSVVNTQSSLGSSQLLTELEDSDERLVLASQIGVLKVPDSQDPSGSTWSQCQVSDLGATPGSLALEKRPPAGGEPPPGSAPSDIPSRQPGPSCQPGPSDSYSPSGRVLPTPATGSESGSRPDGSESPPHPATTQVQSEAGPLFLTQAFLQNTFNFPDSSLLGRASVSPSLAAVEATPTGKSQDSVEGLTHLSDASQDAQVVHRVEYGSQTEVLPGSDNSSQELAANTAGKPNPSVEPENETTTLKDDQQKPSPEQQMEGNKIGDLAPPESRAAVEELSQLFNLDNPVVDSASAVSRREQRPSVPVDSQPSSMQSMQHLVDAAFGTSNDPPSGTLMLDGAQYKQQGTVSPADISKRVESGKGTLPLTSPLASQRGAPSNLFDSSRNSIPMAQVPGERASSEASSDGTPDVNLKEHIVTLPFHASLRSPYDDTILEYREDVTEFSAIFNNEIYVEPEGALVGKIDQLFSRLHNICDYPQDVVGTTLQDLPASQLAKYSCSANPKFNFIHELLQGLQKDTRILIVARSVELLRLLCHVTEALGVECTCEAVGGKKRSSALSAGQVTLALPSDDISVFDYGVVVGFDHSFSTSLVSKRLSAAASGTRKPLVLVLVTTHSIEHIDLHMPEDLGPVERKNALLAGIARARKLVSDPDRGFFEPHELAGIFLEYINGEANTISWEPVPVPEEVLDIFVDSQSRSQMPARPSPERGNGRKRKLADFNDEQVKKMRILPLKGSTVEAIEPPLPDGVREMLESVKIAETSSKSSLLQVKVQVPLAILQALAENHAEYQRQIAIKDTEAEYKAVISGLEKRIKEYERTTNMIYESHRRALEDRSRFEAEKQMAVDALQAAESSARKDSEKAQKRSAELEAAIARLTADPNGSQEETPLARTEKLAKEAEDRVKVLEKRLGNASKDGEYVRNLYQEASTSASAIQAENMELKEQNADLQKKTLDSVARVHRIQAENSTRQYLRQIRELKTQVKDRELELDRTREDLRQLRNGRRETRQVSVPRSPRMGVMSPRPGRAYATAGSRGTSPAAVAGPDGAALPPGVQFLSAQQSGNGRWNHLRD